MAGIESKLMSTVADQVTRRVDKPVAQVIADQTVRTTMGVDAIKKSAAALKVDPVLPVLELPKVKINQALRFIVDAGNKIDAPRLSPDKTMVTYVKRETKDIPTIMKYALGLDPKEATERMTAWIAPVDGSVEPRLVAGRTFHNVVEPAFSPDGKSVVYCEQKNLPFLARGEKLKQMKLDQVDLATGKVTTLYNGDLTLLHPQYSPDGTKLVAYSRDKGRQGLYMMDMTKPGQEPQRIINQNFDDKHPVWSADSKTIFFHNQVGGDAVSGGADTAEAAWLGKIDLTDPKNPKRIMLDDTKTTMFHKHPTPLAGSDLIVYHNDDHKLEVLNTVTGQRAQLKLTGLSPNGSDLKKFKHASFSSDGSEMAMVATGGKDATNRGIPEAWRVYLLDNATQIKTAFQQTFGG